MGFHVCKGGYRKGGKVYTYYLLKRSFRDPQTKAIRLAYVANLGPTRTITLDYALEIAEKAGITLEELCSVRGLRVVDDRGLTITDDSDV